jgi:hypothetical protein
MIAATVLRNRFEVTHLGHENLQGDGSRIAICYNFYAFACLGGG